MAYNELNKLLYYYKVQQITNEHYEEGITSYKGIFEKYVLPIYPMSYNNYLKIISEGQLKTRIEKLQSLQNSI